MDADDVRAMRIKQDRRMILEVLRMASPGFLSFNCLRQVLPEVEEDNLRRDIAYLLDKGYIERIKPQANEEWDDRKYRITAEGDEIANRILKDPALNP